jgi:peptidoglycan/xylan/chitin deacetylase (PgdA/CDA1 family)
MGDDVPYVERAGGASILELPVHWLLDDWPHFGFSGERGGRIAPAEDVFQIWTEEFGGLYEEGAYFMLTMHPEVSGRPYRVALLDRLIRHIKGYPNVWWATADDVAHHCAPLVSEGAGSS